MSVVKLTNFIQEEIQVIYNKEPLLEKKSGCPDKFIWRGVEYIVREKISEWHDYRRTGRKSKNMEPQHLGIAEKRGSWGVGQDYFRVRVDDGRVFDIYYDRSPKSVDRRKGAWFIEKEVLLQG